MTSLPVTSHAPASNAPKDGGHLPILRHKPNHENGAREAQILDEVMDILAAAIWSRFQRAETGASDNSPGGIDRG